MNIFYYKIGQERERESAREILRFGRDKGEGGGQGSGGRKSKGEGQDYTRNELCDLYILFSFFLFLLAVGLFSLY